MEKVIFQPHASGFYFHAETAPAIRETLARLPRSQRVRVFYGDTKTGKAWPEENDVMGYIGRSTGAHRVPLLIHSRASSGGGAILDHCIVGIVCTGSGAWLYKHPQFNPGEWKTAPGTVDGYAVDVLHNGSIHARFKTAARGPRYCAFMRGERFNF